MAVIDLLRLPAAARENLSPLLERASPLQAEVISGLLQRVDLTDCDSVAAYLGLPPLSEFPTAGQARTWGRVEWGAWADAHGYDSRGDTSHSWCWNHPYFQGLVIGVAKTPGDFRTPMAMATQTRRMHRRMLNIGLGVILITIANTVGFSSNNGAHPLPVGLEVTPAYWEQVREQIRSATASAFRDDYFTMQVALRDDHHTVGDVRQVLARITKEHNISARTALAKVTGDGGEPAERLAKTISTQPADAAALLGMYDGLTDLLQQLREESKAERDAKRAAREAERAEQEPEEKPAEEPSHALGQVQQVFDGRRAAILEQLGAVAKAAQSAVDRARYAIDQMPSFTIPPIASGDVEGLKREVEQLKAQLREAKEEAERAKIDRNRLGEVEVPKLKGEVEQLKAYQRHAAAFAQVCIDTVASAQTLNPFQLVAALQTLQSSARELLPTENPAPCAAAG